MSRWQRNDYKLLIFYLVTLILIYAFLIENDCEEPTSESGSRKINQRQIEKLIKIDKLSSHEAIHYHKITETGRGSP